jgi:hypothetical protein
MDVQLKPDKEPPKILHKLKGRNYSVPEQTWRRSGSCPEGTVPIRRTPTTADSEAAKHSLRFFSYAHPTDVTIQDEGKGKLEVSPSPEHLHHCFFEIYIYAVILLSRILSLITKHL